MPVTSGERPSGTGGHAGPVLRWAQVGMAGAGLAAALLAGPTTAAADTGAAAAGADSSAESDAPPRSPGRPAGEPRRGAGSDDEPANPAGSRTDTSEGAGADTGSEPDAEPEVEAELEADLEVEADAVEDVETETDSSGSAGEASAPVIDDADSEPPAGAHGTAPLGEAETTEPDPTRSEPPPSPGAAATQPLTFGAPPATAATSRPQYPAPVDAPVTWRAIVADTLSWLGLGTLPSQPVPDVPVGDLLAGLWVGLRRAHYTFFNSAPVLTAGPATEDPETGLITGQLQAADADGDVVSYVLSGAPGAGTVSLTEDGAYTYTPGAGIAATGGTDTFAVAATDSGPANPWHTNLARRIQSALSAVGFAAPPAPGSTTTVTVTVTPAACRADSGGAACAAARAPKITVHNNSEHTIWVYNLPKSGDYSIGADFTPVSIAKGSSAPVTLAVGTGQPGSPENRIYIVEGESGFTLPVTSPSGVDAFNPTAPSQGNSFLNYSFVEYYLYSADGGYEYTIDTSYIDEWSLPIQFRFALHGSDWSGAVDGKTYGFNDYDTVVNQLKAAGGPYEDLVWSGDTPWGPQPPATVHRIIGPDKVWTAQASQPPSNVNMNQVGWVPTSYQDFVQHGAHTGSDGHTVYPFAQNGTKYSPEGNFTFWKNSVAGPAATPYPIALRTAAFLDGFPAEGGVYGFFTYPNDETAGQFTNIPTAVSLDIYVHGSSDGKSDSVIEGGSWFYTSSASPSKRGFVRSQPRVISGTDATDTFILDSVFARPRTAPLVDADSGHGDIVVIDRTTLGATSYDVDVVDRAWFLGGGLANYDSQFVFDRSTGYLYYDADPGRFGYTGVLAVLPAGTDDPSSTVFVL